MLIVAATQSSAKKAVVINQANGKPLVGVEVKINDKSYISDRNGNLPLGEFTDRPITTYNGIFLNSKTDDNSLVIDFPFTLNKPKKLGGIEGGVTDILENQLNNKKVILSKDGFSYRTTSDRFSYYGFDYLAEGTWELIVPEDDKYLRNETKYLGFNSQVDINGDLKAINKFDIILEKNETKYGSLDITILINNKKPAVGALVTIDTVISSYLDESGVKRIPLLNSGEYNLNISLKGFKPINSKIKIEKGRTLKLEYSLNENGPNTTLMTIIDENLAQESIVGKISNYSPAGGDLSGSMPDPLIAVASVKGRRVASIVTQSSGVSSGGSGYNIMGVPSGGMDDALAPSKSSSSQEIQAGSLTSGEVNDFRKWDMWSDIAKDELSEYVGTWGIEPTKRYTVQLTSLDNKPVSDAEVHLISQTGETIWSSRSDNTGKAELWADAYKAVNDDDNGLSIVINHKNNKQTITNVTEFKDGINFVRINESCSHSKNVDIVFAMDATGSMGDEIEYLKTELLDIIKRLGEAQGDKNLRVGSIFYRDFDYPFSQLINTHDLTNNFESVNNFINSQSAISGNSTPEAVEVALSSAVNEFSWSEDAVARIMFLILDAPPHEDPQTMERFRELTARASAMGIRIIPLTASGIGKETEYLMRSLALLTNGTYLFLTDDSGIGGSHIKPTTDSYDVEMMNEMIVRIINQFIDTPNCEESDDLYAKAIDDNIFNDKEVKGKDIADYIKVYPNPTDGPLTLELEEDLDNLFVVDMNGKILFRVDPKKGTLQINMSDFPSGVYFLKFSHEGAWGSTQIQLRR